MLNAGGIKRPRLVPTGHWWGTGPHHWHVKSTPKSSSNKNMWRYQCRVYLHNKSMWDLQNYHRQQQNVRLLIIGGVNRWRVNYLFNIILFYSTLKCTVPSGKCTQFITLECTVPPRELQTIYYIEIHSALRELYTQLITSYYTVPSGNYKQFIILKYIGPQGTANN